MSWFGGGSKKDEPSEKGFVDEASLGFDAASVGSGSAMGGGGGGLSEFQEFSMAIQQQMIVQQAITELSNRAFVKCITSAKDSQLSGREVACIHAVTNKWLDSNQYLVGRLAKKSQAQQQGAHSFS